MDFILVDKTGPLLVGLKDEAAMQMHKLMKGLGDKLKGKFFDIENLKVADMTETNYNGKNKDNQIKILIIKYSATFNSVQQ